ncbi:hypothetical protein UFOVP123_17 [uncultured Caudovirales phage]|uniref:Uncharacterized protein n=1 Tax=uncultured Caudovirales phage TaxID=2100421 RepID=A0A6J5LB96_9CAUD|nr:hypothetical protein UFOVP123_17 [uncultured Caudovirales phage]
MSYNIEQANSGFLSLTAAGLAVGTNTGTFKTANTLAFTNNGIFKSKAATDNLTFSSGHTALAASQACLFGIWISAAGSIATTQGPIQAAGDPCPVPAAIANYTLVGLIKVTTSSSGAFTPGTTGLGASGVTAAYSDCMDMPGSAQ